MTLAAPFADIEDMLTETTFALLSNVVVTPAIGAAFLAMLDSATQDAFDLTRATDITLRWPAASATLGESDEITANGQRYRLAEPPVTLNAHELSARLTHLGAA